MVVTVSVWYSESVWYYDFQFCEHQKPLKSSDLRNGVGLVFDYCEFWKKISFKVLKIIFYSKYNV